MSTKYIICILFLTATLFLSLAFIVFDPCNMNKIYYRYIGTVDNQEWVECSNVLENNKDHIVGKSIYNTITNVSFDIETDKEIGICGYSSDVHKPLHVALIVAIIAIIDILCLAMFILNKNEGETNV